MPWELFENFSNSLLPKKLTGPPLSAKKFDQHLPWKTLDFLISEDVQTLNLYLSLQNSEEKTAGMGWNWMDMHSKMTFRVCTSSEIKKSRVFQGSWKPRMKITFTTNCLKQHLIVNVITVKQQRAPSV